MERDCLTKAIARTQESGEPLIEFISRAKRTGSRVGVFASSFNPVTNAHVELMQRAARGFNLDETLALAGVANADKNTYECPLEDRLAMLLSAFEHDPSLSIGVCSHAYFVDVLGALGHLYPAGTDFHFILGFDTFERVLDRNDLYTRRYHRRFGDRIEALRFLIEHARLVVAGRGASRRLEIAALLEHEPSEIAANVLYLDLPSEMAERSATEVRDRAMRGQSIEGLVPPRVESYIVERGIYRDREIS